MTKDQIVDLLNKEIADAQNIDNIPRSLPLKDKVVFVQVKQELSQALQRIRDLAEGKRSPERKDPKDQFYSLP